MTICRRYAMKDDDFPTPSSGVFGWLRNLGVQWVSPLCVDNGRSLDVNECMIKFASNYAFYKFLLVGFCCCGAVYGWFYAVVAEFACRQRCSVCGVQRQIALFSPMCSVRSLDLDVQLWTGFF